jgi:hypothetical protein
MNARKCLATLTLLVTFGCAKEPAAPPAPPPAVFKTTASVKQLMQAIIIPASDAVWGVATEQPRDDATWLTVENSALALAESGNLLMMGTRAVDQQDWTKYSTALIDSAAMAAEAIRAQDVERISAAGDAIYEICEGCHMQYMKPQE